MTFDNGSIHAEGESEIVCVDNQPSQAASLTGLRTCLFQRAAHRCVRGCLTDSCPSGILWKAYVSAVLLKAARLRDSLCLQLEGG